MCQYCVLSGIGATEESRQLLLGALSLSGIAMLFWVPKMNFNYYFFYFFIYFLFFTDPLCGFPSGSLGIQAQESWPSHSWQWCLLWWLDYSVPRHRQVDGEHFCRFGLHCCHGWHPRHQSVFEVCVLIEFQKLTNLKVFKLTADVRQLELNPRWSLKTLLPQPHERCNFNRQQIFQISLRAKGSCKFETLRCKSQKRSNSTEPGETYTCR